jgi:hypothetical protein
MSELIGIAATTISILALCVSTATAYLTLFRRGTVKMTRPTVIYVGSEKGAEAKPPKIYLRALLFATSKRGRIVESMHVNLARNETSQNFNIWVHGDDKLVRGSGLFVGDTGVAANHHFLSPKDGSNFRFVEGEYTLNVHAKLLGDTSPVILLSQKLNISRENAAAIEQPDTGLYFDWGPDSARYIPHVETRPNIPQPDEIMKLLGLGEKPTTGKQRAKI